MATPIFLGEILKTLVKIYFFCMLLIGANTFVLDR